MEKYNETIKRITNPFPTWTKHNKGISCVEYVSCYVITFD